MKNLDYIKIIKTWIWFIVLSLVESATIFKEPIKLWWLVLIINYLIAVFMVYTNNESKDK